MRWGIIRLYCVICGVEMIHDGNKPNETMFHRELGKCCSKACWERAELKYARMILGKDDLAP
jgi:hypothetical protein